MLRIDRIEINNFRCFTKTEVAFEPLLTVIVAHNGQGKSSLLDGLKVTLWPFVAGFDLGGTTNGRTGIHLDDVRRVRTQGHQMEWRIPCTLMASGSIAIPDLMRHFFPAEDTALPWKELRVRDSIHKNAKTKVKALGPSQSLDHPTSTVGSVSY